MIFIIHYLKFTFLYDICYLVKLRHSWETAIFKWYYQGQFLSTHFVAFLEFFDTVQLIHSYKRPYFGVRHIFAFFGFLGFVNVYAMRVNLSIAIVSMVNNTNQNEGTDSINHTDDTCHGFSQINSTHINKNQGGFKFNWDAETQSTVLGSFFYG